MVEKESCFVAEFQWQAGRIDKRMKLCMIVVENGIDRIIDKVLSSM